MNFGDRFINVMDGDPRVVGATSLDARLDALLPALGVGPFTLYMGRSATFRGVRDLDSRFSLWMGPGAVITLQPGARLIVRGSVDLGIEPRFDTRAGDGAEVQLLGALDALRPEWWRHPNDWSDALDAVVAAARARILASVPQVPIRLIGPYGLSRTLELATPPGSEAVGFVFVGRHPRGDAVLAPTFWRSLATPGRFPLLRTQPRVRISMRHVAFDTTQAVPSVAKESQSAAVVHDGFASGIEYDRCTFSVGSGDGVVLRPIERSARSELDGLHDRVRFVRCWFQMQPDGPAEGVAVRVDQRGSVRLQLDGCAFRGSARAMVSMPSGVCEVTGCDFANAIPREFDPGVDLLLGESAIVDDGGVAVDDLGPLLVAETHVQSRTVRHLHGRMLASQPGTVCLSGLVHQPDLGGRAANLLPPAMDWTALVGGGLLLQGCHVSGTVASSPATRVALVATETRGVPPTRGGVVSVVG